MVRIGVLCALLATPAESKRLADHAKALYRKGEFKKACALYEQRTSIDPYNPDAWLDLGLCWRRLGRRDQAVDATLHAIPFASPGQRKAAYFNLGLLERTVEVPRMLKPVASGPEGDELHCEQRACESELLTMCLDAHCAHGNRNGSCTAVMTMCQGEADGGCAFPSEDTNPPEVEHPIQGIRFLAEHHTEPVSSRCLDESCTVDLHPSVACRVVFLDVCERRAGIFCTFGHVKRPPISGEVSW